MSKNFFTGDLIKDDIKKIPKFANGGICNDAMFPTFDMFPEIDEIVKDIRKQKDNAMAMEFTKCIGELLRKNGVVPKITEVRNGGTFDKDRNVIETRYGVSIDELDFSEHDKVFENEIAGLKAKIAIKDMDYKTASELLGKYQRENEALKKRIDELEKELSSVVKEAERKEFIREMSCLEIQELKQRIAELEKENLRLTESVLRKETKIHELESKEVEKPTKYITVIVAKEINGQEYVRLEEFVSVVNDLQAKIGT